jgi:hypothetical protein
LQDADLGYHGILGKLKEIQTVVSRLHNEIETLYNDKVDSKRYEGNPKIHWEVP